MQWILRTLALAVLATLLAGQATRSGPLSFLYTAAPRYDPDAWSQGRDRFADGARLVLVTSGSRRDLVPGFFASADAAVSFDGRKVLFSGRRSRQDSWQVFQMDLAGGSPVPVTGNSGACIRPLYLPAGRIAYTRLTASGSQIEVVPLAGGKPDVLTHAPGYFLTDDVLHDGRILFEWQSDLFTVYPDGTGVESLRCDHGPRRSGGRQVGSSDVLFSVSGALARFTSALAVQEQLPPVDFQLLGPVAEVAPARWLISARPRSGGAFAIYQADSRLHPMERLEAPQKANAVEPVAVQERTPPRDFPSALVPARKTGNLLCLDAREGKTSSEKNVHSVRFYGLAANGQPELLGQTPVAADGSFYVEIPPDRPVRMELLNAAGARLKGEEHWFWMRPSEQRICVGCHVGPERAPENKVPEILNETIHPAKMLGDFGRTQ